MKVRRNGKLVTVTRIVTTWKTTQVTTTTSVRQTDPAASCYPAYKNLPGYWSADCRDGGPLDLNPGSSLWP